LARLPGWYQDPFLRTAYRFWNGSVWTHDVYVKHGSQLSPSSDLLAYPQSSNDPDPTTPLIGSPWALLAVTFAGLGIAFALSLILVLVDELFGRPGGAVVTLVMSELGLWSGLFATCIVASRTFGSRSLRSDFGLAFRLKDIGIGSLGAIMARFLTAVVGYIVIIFAPRVVNPDVSLIRAVNTSSIALLIYCLIVCIGAPFFEELFFRGLLQTQLVQRIGVGAGIVVTSVLFAALHIANAPGIPGLELAAAIAPSGLVLGYVRYRRGRLGSSMVAHALFNILATVLLIGTVLH